jgi:ubiquitin-like-conjugating enzyme ATG3
MSTASHTAANNIRDFISIFRDPPKQSKFYSDGILTPDEFVKSGDYLVSKCPTWKWCKAEKGYVNKYLPENKQYLKTTVPSYRRASDYLQNNSTKEKVVEGDWVDADLENKSKVKKPVVIDLDDEDKKEKKKCRSSGSR